MQIFYGQCIRNHISDIEGMQNSVWAMFGHMIADDSLPLHEQHHPCPRDSDLFILLSFDNIKLRNFNCVFLKITICPKHFKL